MFPCSSFSIDFYSAFLQSSVQNPSFFLSFFPSLSPFSYFDLFSYEQRSRNEIDSTFTPSRSSYSSRGEGRPNCHQSQGYHTKPDNHLDVPPYPRPTPERFCVCVRVCILCISSVSCLVFVCVSLWGRWVDPSRDPPLLRRARWVFTIHRFVLSNRKVKSSPMKLLGQSTRWDGAVEGESPSLVVTLQLFFYFSFFFLCICVCVSVCLCVYHKMSFCVCVCVSYFRALFFSLLFLVVCMCVYVCVLGSFSVGAGFCCVLEYVCVSLLSLCWNDAEIVRIDSRLEVLSKSTVIK